MDNEILMDWHRGERVGLDEAVYAAGKTVSQLVEILTQARDRHHRLLLTRLGPEQWAKLPSEWHAALDYCGESETAIYGEPPEGVRENAVAIVAAGTSDVPVAREAQRTLAYQGEHAPLIADVGVAGLWRLTSQLERLRAYPVLIAVAGMDAALPTVLGGLVQSAIIAVPTSVGYGASHGGLTALNAILASCAQGITVVNIDNGFGAACAAVRILNGLRSARAEAARRVAA